MKVLRSANIAGMVLLAVATLGVAPHPALAAIRLGSPNTTSLNTGLVGYWPLDGAVTNWNTNTTADISGNGNTGTLVSMSTTSSPTEGKIGQAFRFPASADSVMADGTNYKFAAGQNFSVAAWFKSTDSGYYHQVLGTESANNRIGWAFIIDGLHEG